MFMNLLTNIWSDLHDPNVLWQVAVMLVCLSASYFFAQFLRQHFSVDASSAEADVIAAQSFTKMFFPILLFVFLCFGKFILLHWQHMYLLSLFIPITGAWAVTRFGIFLSRRSIVHADKIGRLHLAIERIFCWAVWIIVSFYYTGFLQEIWAFMDKTSIPLGRNKLSIAEIVQALVSAIVTVLLALWASASLDKRLMKVSSLHTSSRMVLSRVGRSLLIVFAILISLNLVGIDLTVLSIFGGALGVGMGLGLQKIASNYVSGFIILLERSLSINDMLTVDKYSGKVTEINTRYTVLKGLDGVESVIPNEMLISSPVQNWSLTDKEIWMSTDVCVAYSTDIESLLPMLVKAVSVVPRVSTRLLPAAYLMNFGANGLELRIGFWISDPENGKSSALSAVNRAIWKLLQEQNIEVPYPQTELRVLSNGRETA